MVVFFSGFMCCQVGGSGGSCDAGETGRGNKKGMEHGELAWQDAGDLSSNPPGSLATIRYFLLIPLSPLSILHFQLSPIFLLCLLTNPPTEIILPPLYIFLLLSYHRLV